MFEDVRTLIRASFANVHHSGNAADAEHFDGKTTDSNAGQAGLESACQKQDDQYEKDDPAKATAYPRATHVKPASAEQHQQDDQHK